MGDAVTPRAAMLAALTNLHRLILLPILGLPAACVRAKPLSLTRSLLTYADAPALVNHGV